VLFPEQGPEASMPMTGTCHCGKVRVTVPRRPRSVTDCNCSICRRYGVLWAYYRAKQVKVEGARNTESYKWGRKALNFVRCKTCGVLVAWQRVKKVTKLDGAKWGGHSW
jgi:hypothetical protein